MPVAQQEFFNVASTKIVDKIHQYLHNSFKDFKNEPLKSFVKGLMNEWLPSSRGLDKARRFSIEEVLTLAW